MRKFLVLVLLVLAAILLTSFSVSADAVCPKGSGWTKIETTGEPYSITIHADPGFVIGQVCIKRSTIVQYFTVNNTPFSIAFGDHAISHYSYTQVPREPNPNYALDVDCEGWEVIYLPDEERNEGTLVASGKWSQKDVLEAASVYIEQLEITVDVFEPKRCYECVPKTVFYWTDGLCMIRQREGPIGGQTRPFRPMQNLYCGCDYAHDDGWEGIFANSCTGPEEYKYWNELPQFCGQQCPEALSAWVTP